MAYSQAKQPQNLPATPQPSAHKRLSDAYVANLVGDEELRRFVLTHGPGEAAASWVAGRQLAVITFRQLELSGLSRTAIATRARRRLLHRQHRGVYLYGHPTPLPGAIELAAALACGERAVVSHRSAAVLFGIASPAGESVQVTVVRRSCRSRTGLRVHSVERLEPLDHGFVRGIPITSPARTLVDLAGEATSGELERAIAEAYAQKLVTEKQLNAAADRAPNHGGVAALRAQLRRDGGPQWTQSEGERRMLKLIRAAGLPAPQTQVRVAGWPADFLWAAQRLIVEVDGYPFHSGRRAFERDRRRDQAHIAAGYTVIRVTWRQLTEEPLAVVATIARVLARDSR
jgi:very-short-patch-repair endonuclease